MTNEFDTPSPAPQKKNYTSTIVISAVALIILVAVTLIVTSRTSIIDDNIQCCETLCAEFNQECRGWVQDTLECTYNYERFEYPEVDEVFAFIINDSMRDRLCNAEPALETPIDELQ